MHYAEKVAGEPILLDPGPIQRAWEHYQAETIREGAGSERPAGPPVCVNCGD